MNQLRTKRITAQRAAALLQSMNVENSDGGDTCSEDEQFHNVREESSSDENGMDEVVSPAGDSERRDVSKNIHPSVSVAGENGSAYDRDRSGWKFLNVNSVNNLVSGRARSHHVFREKSGVTQRVKKQITTELDAWRLFVSDDILRHIHECTLKHACSENHDLKDFAISDLEKFIAIQYARGIYGKNHSLNFLWSKQFGIPLINSIMSRNYFVTLKTHLRFDDKQTRSFRVEDDAFTHIRFVTDRISANFRKAYVPNFCLTIDEQLMPLKCRCPFIVFMPNKPDKFGVKFWLITDNSSKYIYYFLPYLGKHDADRNGKRLANHVVEKLSDTLLNKGYNISCDNFFTNISLAEYLISKKTSLVGTIRSNSAGIPKDLIDAKLAKYDSQFCFSPEKEILLTKYQCKVKKNVFLLSTLHVNPMVDESPKRKPNVIHFYNKSKCGVDCADAMLRLYSTRCATRRWPLAVWENILDMVALNAWICFTNATGSTISRKDFILALVMQLSQPQVSSHSRVESAGSVGLTDIPLPPAKRMKCCILGCRNKTNIFCKNCHKSLCGTHCENRITKVSFTTCDQCQCE